jgi:hypothetical protein
MKTLRSRWTWAVLGSAGVVLLQACAVTGVGVSGSVGYDSGYYDSGYYEPYGYDYGGWGGGYRVGPGRGGYPRGGVGGHPGGGHPGGGGRPSYHPAPAGRASPSIPNRSRGH